MVTSSRLTLVLAFTLGFGWSRDASAQLEHHWSSDVSVGVATVNSGEFLNDLGKAVAHLAIADRVLQRGRFAAYAEAGYDWLGEFWIIGTNPDLECEIRPGASGCAPPYPDVTGPSVSIGMLYAPFTRVETRVGVGGAAYSVGGTVVGAAVGQLDAAVFPAAGLGLTLGTRFAVVPGYRHDRLTMAPVLLGLRVR
jgi:hypothetical protein